MRKSKPFAHAKLTVKSGKSSMSGKDARVFIDSGASVSVMPTKLAQQVEAKMGSIESETINVHTVGGQKTVRRLKGVKLCLESVCAVSDVIVTDGSFGDMAVGTDYLSKAGCVIDFKKKTMKCDGKEIKLKMED